MERGGDEPRSVEPLAAFAALGDPTRRALYEFVAGQGGWIGREQAADAVGIGRTLAAHHLDRLAADGLVDVDYRRTTERRGPGAGRPAKLYRRAGRQFQLTLPPRRYELVARLLADAVDNSRRDGVAIERALELTARQAGEAMAEERRGELPRRAGCERVRAAVAAELSSHGYEPIVDRSGAVTLRNCPFHELAEHHIELVCGLNLALLDGLVGAMPTARLDACLDPAEGRCCVTLVPRPASARPPA